MEVLYNPPFKSNSENCADIFFIYIYIGWQKVEVNLNDEKQTMNGFGGAMTDAAIINLQTLNKDASDAIMQGYYGAGGIKYSIMRVPIASCDFSSHEYSYDDMDRDFTMVKYAVHTLSSCKKY